MIDIICPYCYDKINGELINERRNTFVKTGLKTLTRQYCGYCKDCGVCLNLEVSADLEDWD